MSAATENDLPKGITPEVVKQTPMVRQYLEQKTSHPDCIVFFRLGDFYEMFFEDAEIASKILDLALTSRSKGEGAIPMCGVPHFSANSYIAKLVEQGYKVAVCDQMEDPRLAKGIVKREVTRVISPGMITDPESLDARESNYLAGVEVGDGGAIGFSYLDISTADFRMSELPLLRDLIDELGRVRPRELLLSSMEQGREVHQAVAGRIKNLFIKFVNLTEEQGKSVVATWEDHFPGKDLAASGCDQMELGLKAARSVFGYVAASLPGTLDHLRRLVPYRVTEHLVMDEYSRTNLELTRTLMGGSRKGSLIELLDQTRTPMGARMLADWLHNPLFSPEKIRERADAVGQLFEDAVLRTDLRSCLGSIRDLERLLGRVAVGQANPRDLGAIRDSLGKLPVWAGLVRKDPGRPLDKILGVIDLLEGLHRELSAALVEDLPVDLDEGGAIRPGYNHELDRSVALSRDGRDFIARLEQKERERTGIASLKIRYNRVFGYYIEVTKPNLSLVPADYRRKQTTANAERFETEELKAQEDAILGAQEQRVALEREIVAQLTGRVRAMAERLLRTATQLATSDVLASVAEVAAKNGYHRPVVDESEVLDISDGRHPVVERLIVDERFVPNDLRVDCSGEQLLIITGPNMAGKSTVIRQAALIVIMAQMGGFVPAGAARIGVVDRIFTRIGAADSLARGQSTFMVEMMETSLILHHATRRSLLILDEVGRGTSTFDGLSIAWAVAEYIHDRIGARTLFATHYHQLADLALTKKRVVNCTVTVKEWKDQIIFLRRLVKGISNRSYGIQVAKLAGLPGEVIERSREILANLEGQEYDEVGAPRLSRSPGEKQKPSPGQLQLFGGAERSAFEDELDKLDLDVLSGLEALNLLHRWKKKK